ncbi:hypothetical protein [Modestobacter versicolor]|uniref:hypothetical protein n=1 Tax=Modestobacter versicolor TaxID=429133 RepID=UPI0034DEB389
MSILSKLMGTAQQTAGRSRTGRSTGRPVSGRRTTGMGRTGGGTARMARGTSSRGRAAAPAAGGLGKLLSSFAKRR